MKFSLWLERKATRDAILGVIGASPEEQKTALARKTTYFGSEIRSKIKNLGAVKNADNVPGKSGELLRAIDDGITIGELIRRVGKN